MHAVNKEAGKQDAAVKAEPTKGAKGKGKANSPLANSFSKSTGKRPAKQPTGTPALEAKEPKQETADAPMAGQDSDDEQLAEQINVKPKKESQQVRSTLVSWFRLKDFG